MTLLLFKRKRFQPVSSKNEGGQAQPGGTPMPSGTGSNPTYGRVWLDKQARAKAKKLERKKAQALMRISQDIATAASASHGVDLWADQISMLTEAVAHARALNDSIEEYGRIVIIRELALRVLREIEAQRLDEELTLLIMLAS